MYWLLKIESMHLKLESPQRVQTSTNADQSSINQSVVISVAKIAEAITKSTVAQLEDDARK